MGDKLGKILKKIYILVLTTVVSLNADPDIGGLNKLASAEGSVADKDIKIIEISATSKNIKLENIKIGKFNNHSLNKFNTISKRDRYAIKVLDEKGKQVLLVGLGDPFYIHADHIGHEDNHVFGGNIQKNLELVLPKNINPEYLILLKQGRFGFNEIKKIKVN
jgi:hypothetical protein